MTNKQLESTRQGRILLVMKNAFRLSKKYDYNGTIVNNKNPQQIITRLQNTEYMKLSEQSEEMRVIKYYCDRAINDINEEQYSSNVKNLISQFIVIFVEQGKDHSRIVNNDC